MTQSVSKCAYYIACLWHIQVLGNLHPNSNTQSLVPLKYNNDMQDFLRVMIFFEKMHIRERAPAVILTN